MAEETTITIKDAMGAAFAALLRGDTAERDRLVRQAQATFDKHGGQSLPNDTPLEMPQKEVGVLKYLTKEQILAIPKDEPERLFTSNDPDKVKTEYRELAKQWHPDRHSGDGAVLAHINILHDAAEVIVNNALPWRTFSLDDTIPGKLDIRTKEGGTFRAGYRRKHTFPLGTIYTGAGHTTTLISATHQEMFDRAKARIRGVTYLDDKMRQAIRPTMPEILKDYSVDDKLGLTIKKNPDQLLLRDVIDHCGGKIEPRHAAWMISRAYGIACFFWLQRLIHLDLSPLSLYVCPEQHSLSPLGGWWFAYEEGQKITALPKRTHDNINPRLLRDRVAVGAMMTEQVKALGRELLGDISGGSIMFDTDIPQAMRQWLMLPGTDTPLKEYSTWQNKVLLESFGPRKFVKFEVTEADVYNLPHKAA